MTASLPAPVDVKLMNITATVLFLGFGVLLVVAGVRWALNHQLFAIAGITVTGDTAHNSVATLRANVAPRLAGNFFTLDLKQAQGVFETAPWVRKAVVRKQFPNRLKVQLQEHQAVAFWGAEGETRMVNSFGEVFEANAGEVETENLPRLAGPDGESAQVLGLYRSVAPLFEPLDLSVEELTLTGRGSWSLQLDTGAVVELGRGTPQEVAARAQRFVQTLTQVTGKYARRPEALVSADLRHENGYAIRLRGVTTTEAQPKR
ncbi:cell division protein FtsQ/DivIB [Ramlibacter albus]|uniref:Cell division protein FtsQ n=1 Tax=Ramlibacter albus TaxID=2079448 RepID=A0A923MAH1_9BURK|nr:cell division protein FtsQ/DivIB [Ramlibacter albus]MBC5765497.1 FtsQ-type POTRA domain-containing protein [Ramlibacter albus]